MIKTFSQMPKEIKSQSSKIKKIAVVCAEDEEVLAAIRQAQDDGIVSGILTGDKNKIIEISEKHKISLNGFEIINEPDKKKAATICTQLIRKGEAAAIMKGSIDSSKYMKAILNKETGLNEGGFLSHVAVFELEHYPKFLMISDAGLNIAPDISQKTKIINNAVKVAKGLGVQTPLVACCTAVEKVNSEAMSCTIDAAVLAKMNDRGQITGCIVDGPFGLDNAISEESARIKNIKSPVAGKADIILANDIESGNYLYKALVFLAKAKSAAIVIGASAPVILTSRADSHESKYNSIMLSLFCS